MTKKSAQKRQRVEARRRQRNKAVRSQVKTRITQAEKVIFSGDLEAAREAVNEAVSVLDGAAGKDILHARNASRRKSRLMRKLNAAAAEAESQPAPTEEAA